MREIFFLVLTILVLEAFLPTVGAKVVTLADVSLEAMTTAVTTMSSGTTSVPGK